MCLAVPLKIVSLSGKEALCEIGGVQRKIRLDFLEKAEVGDYVMAHAGFAIEKLEEAQARENLKLIMEVADAAGKSL